MTDVIAIAPELSFRAQVTELATHLSRCVPSSSDAAASRDFIAGYESQLKEGEEDDEGKRKEVVRSIVAKVGETRGALEGVNERDVESSHLLLQYVLSSTFSGEEFEQVYRAVLDALKKGVEAHGAANRLSRLEVAARILNNNYNSLPAASPLRAPTLLALLTALSKFTDLSSLPLTPTQLSAAADQWSIPSSEKATFLSSAADIYRSAGHYSTSYDVLLIALRVEAKADVAEKAAIVAVLDEKRFSVDALVQSQALSGEGKELVGLLSEEDAVGAVKKGTEWVGAKSAWIQGKGISTFTPETILRKLRLLALASLCTSTSSSRTLTYDQISTALAIPTSDVESWVFDAIRCDLLKARISQPAATVRIISVSSAADRAFGKDQWELLARRLGEWKGAVEEARRVVGEAEEVAQQGLVQQQGQGGRRYGGERRERQERQGGQQGQGQGQGQQDQVQREEVLA